MNRKKSGDGKLPSVILEFSFYNMIAGYNQVFGSNESSNLSSRVHLMMASEMI